jgi:hypothetical protein
MSSPLSIINTCRVCESSDFIPLFAFKPVPLAGDFCDTYQEALNAPKYPITFVVNKESGLIQSKESIDPNALFLKYKYDSSSIPALVKHFEGLANQLKIRYINKTNVNLLEIGSNSNPLLNQLASNWRLTAVDPSDVAARAHRTPNIRFFNDFFSSDFVEKNGMIGCFDAITASNCLAHVPNLCDIFTGIKLALRHGGDFWIEVKDGDTMLDSGSCDDLYLEHCALWTIDALKHTLGKFGFRYVRHEVLPFHGGLLRGLFVKTSDPVNYPLPDDYFEKITTKAKRIQEFYDNLPNHPITQKLAQCPNNVAFGASGKATMMLNMLEGVRFSYIIDESPLKVGKYIPGVAVPIVSPRMLKSEVEKRNLLVTAWNYFENIHAKYKDFGNFDWLKYF